MYKNILGLNLYYEEENPNADQTVLVVHGWGASIAAIKPVINSLKHKYRVISLELPGHGSSDKPSEVFGTKDFSDIIIKFIDSMNLKDIYYIGHSYGGKCAIEIASRNDNPIKKLVLVDASGIKAELSTKLKLKVKWFKFLKMFYTKIYGENNLEKFYKKYGSADYKDADGVMRKILVKVVNEDLRDKLFDIKTNTLIVWGKNDIDTPLWMGEMMHERIKNSNLAVLDGGHYSYLDDIIGFRNVVLPFLEE